MHDIDFLPAEYREKHERRRNGNQGLAVTLAVVVAVACSGAWQLFRYHQASRQLGSILPYYSEAMTKSNLLASKQAELKPEIAAAELVAYLHHPWPKSRILRAVVAPLPETVNLEQLTIGRQADETGKPRSIARSENEDKKTPIAAPPAARDLETLRARYDAAPVVVSLAGTATDTVALHHYLGELKRNPLFAEVELRDMESTGAERQTLFQFHATVQVSPGYGQPGGPQNPDLNGALAHSTPSAGGATP